MKKYLYLSLVFAAFVFTDSLYADLPDEQRITDILAKQGIVSNTDTREKLELISSERKTILFTSDDLREIGFGLKNLTDSLNETSSTSELLEVIAAKGIAIVDPEHSSPDYDQHREQVFKNQELLAAKARQLLSAQGDSIIDSLLINGASESATTDYISNALKITAEVGSPRAKQSLLDIIDLKVKGWSVFGSEAALPYYLRIADLNEARQLVSSRGDRVLQETIRFFPELVKEPAVFDRVSDYLQSNELDERLWALNALMRLEPEETVSQRVRVIAESIKTVHQISKPDDRYAQTYLGTRCDYLYAALCRALVSMSHADDDLADAAGEMEGLAGKWIIAARAFRGDASVKDEVVSLLKDPAVLERTSLRLLAVSALGTIGTQEDIVFLKQLQENDPLRTYPNNPEQRNVMTAQTRWSNAK